MNIEIYVSAHIKGIVKQEHLKPILIIIENDNAYNVAEQQLINHPASSEISVEK